MAEVAPALGRLGDIHTTASDNLAGALYDLLSVFSRVARDLPDQVFHDLEDLLPRYLPVRQARVVQNTADGWKFWATADRARPGGLDPASFGEAAGSAAKTGTSARLRDGHMFFTICPGEIGLVAYDPEPAAVDALACLAIYAEAVLTAIRPGSSAYRQKIITAFSRVATTILHSDDLTDVFFNITEVAKAELTADISGIMLLEGDDLVMQRCVGNASPRTEKLSMAVGQGIGGRVLATAKPCAVEDYVASSQISRDFIDLARVEKVRSALAVPLFEEDRIVGVLEVWRRRPSSFSEENVAELETLAQLASLAIAHANLIAAQKQTLRELETANTDLSARADVVEFSANLQHSLVRCVLEGRSLDEIASVAAEALETPVFILDGSADVRASSNTMTLSKRDIGVLQIQLAAAPRSARKSLPVSLGRGGTTLVCHPIYTISGRSGWVALAEMPDGGPDKGVMALSAISVTVALHDMKSQAAFAALSEKVSGLVWDILDAPLSIRRLALGRLDDLGIALTNQSCVIICSLRETGEGSGRLSVAERNLDLRLSLAQTHTFLARAGGGMTPLVSTRGEEIAVVFPWHGKAKADGLARDLERQIAATATDITCDIGISSACADPQNLSEALRQAQLARDVARGSENSDPVHFEDLGLVGLMMGFRDGIRFDEFGQRTLGALADDSPTAATLRATLECYLSLNCHQGQTAEALGVHAKTVAYRIERCRELTGLELKSQEDRVLLGLALKAHELGMRSL